MIPNRVGGGSPVPKGKGKGKGSSAEPESNVAAPYKDKRRRTVRQCLIVHLRSNTYRNLIC